MTNHRHPAAHPAAVATGVDRIGYATPAPERGVSSNNVARVHGRIAPMRCHQECDPPVFIGRAGRRARARAARRRGSAAGA